jgi:hypothetical protein
MSRVSLLLYESKVVNSRPCRCRRAGARQGTAQCKQHYKREYEAAAAVAAYKVIVNTRTRQAGGSGPVNIDPVHVLCNRMHTQ